MAFSEDPEKFAPYFSNILTNVFPRLIPALALLNEKKDSSFFIFDGREEDTPYPDIAGALNLPPSAAESKLFAIIVSPVSEAMDLLKAKFGADLRKHPCSVIGIKSFDSLLAKGIDIEPIIDGFPDFWLFRGKTFFHVLLRRAEEGLNVPNSTEDASA